MESTEEVKLNSVVFAETLATALHEQESTSRYPVRLDMNTKTSIMAAIILAMGVNKDGEPLTADQAVDAAVDLEQAVTTRVRELKSHAKHNLGIA